jgi:hypothetical protein
MIADDNIRIDERMSRFCNSASYSHNSGKKPPAAGDQPRFAALISAIPQRKRPGPTT